MLLLVGCMGLAAGGEHVHDALQDGDLADETGQRRQPRDHQRAEEETGGEECDGRGDGAADQRDFLLVQVRPMRTPARRNRQPPAATAPAAADGGCWYGAGPCVRRRRGRPAGLRRHAGHPACLSRAWIPGLPWRRLRSTRYSHDPPSKATRLMAKGAVKPCQIDRLYCGSAPPTTGPAATARTFPMDRFGTMPTTRHAITGGSRQRPVLTLLCGFLRLFYLLRGDAPLRACVDRVGPLQKLIARLLCLPTGSGQAVAGLSAAAAVRNAKSHLSPPACRRGESKHPRGRRASDPQQ